MTEILAERRRGRQPLLVEKCMSPCRGQINFKEKRPGTSLQFRATKEGSQKLGPRRYLFFEFKTAR